jgi:predicted nucleotidyltransferase
MIQEHQKNISVDVNEDKQEVYIRWLRQAASRPAVKEKLYAHAWEVAQTAARLLKERYGVSRVRVFGSLVHARWFHEGSDIDLAVEGLKPDDYWEAVTSILFLDDRVPVELVDRTMCCPEIWEVVEREGVDL